MRYSISNPMATKAIAHSKINRRSWRKGPASPTGSQLGGYQVELFCLRIDGQSTEIFRRHRHLRIVSQSWIVLTRHLRQRRQKFNAAFFQPGDVWSGRECGIRHQRIKINLVGFADRVDRRDHIQMLDVTNQYLGFDKESIRLTLLKPERIQYRNVFEALMSICRKGRAIAADKRLSEAGRRARVDQLVDAVCHCTGDRFVDENKPADDAEKDFFNLTHEIVRLMSEDELFTFVIYPEADGTNNISERQLRDAAQDRMTGRTNKTERGARRRTVITSVLDPLRAHVPKLTLKTLLTALDCWPETGISCFRRLVKKLKLPPLSLPEKIVSPRQLLVPLNKAPTH